MSPGLRVSERLRPTARDYFVLKPKHSGFFDTTLDTLLEALHVRRLILSGIAGNICVLFTANDAHMREFTLIAARLYRLEYVGRERPRPPPDSIGDEGDADNVDEAAFSEAKPRSLAWKSIRERVKR